MEPGSVTRPDPDESVDWFSSEELEDGLTDGAEPVAENLLEADAGETPTNTGWSDEIPPAWRMTLSRPDGSGNGRLSMRCPLASNSKSRSESSDEG